MSVFDYFFSKLGKMESIMSQIVCEMMTTQAGNKKQKTDDEIIAVIIFKVIALLPGKFPKRFAKIKLFLLKYSQNSQAEFLNKNSPESSPISHAVAQFFIKKINRARLRQKPAPIPSRSRRRHQRRRRQSVRRRSGNDDSTRNNDNVGSRGRIDDDKTGNFRRLWRPFRKPFALDFHEQRQLDDVDRRRVVVDDGGIGIPPHESLVHFVHGHRQTDKRQQRRHLIPVVFEACKNSFCFAPIFTNFLFK